MPAYEMTIITKPSISDEQHEAVKSKVESVVKQYKGEMLYFEDWGNRRLQHEIQKERKGRYQYFTFNSKGETVKEIERNLRLSEDVMRFLTVRCNEKTPLEELRQPTAMAKKAKAAAQPAAPASADA